jgi:pimeloyl-ACP methyl ester carboxylesterase
MTTFVLVHGALHGSWCWRHILAPLRHAGHSVDAIDLRAQDSSAGTGFAASVEAVAAAVNRAQPPVVVVAHSLGGAKVSQYLEGAPDVVAGVVLVNALMVEDGEAVLAKLQTAGEDCVFMRPGALNFSEDATTLSVTAAAAAEGFYNRCGPADAAWAAAQLCPEPVPPLLQPLHLSAKGFGMVPKIYLGSRHDRVLPWWMQEKMAKAAGAQLIELGGDHSPFLSVPDELVGQLLSIKEKWGRP